MKTNQAVKLFNQADEMINQAKNEINKAKEDVVPHLICLNTRSAIANYLKAYLIQHDLPVPETTNLDDFLAECRKGNKLFNDLDLSSIDCRFDHESYGYCNNMDKIQRCFDLAEKTRSLTEHKKWPLSLHTK